MVAVVEAMEEAAVGFWCRSTFPSPKFSHVLFRRRRRQVVKNGTLRRLNLRNYATAT